MNSLDTDDSVANKSRRTFTKSGAIVAPVILSLANRSALANNMCSVSGYISYHAAGAIQSHTNNQPNVGWLTPITSVSKQGWYESTTWPSGFGRCSMNGTSSSYYSTTLWSGAKTFSQVQTFETQNKMTLLLADLFSSLYSGNAATLLDALAHNDLTAYRIASALNNAVSPMPSYLLSSACTLQEYQTFYAACT
jgi:hypothetical protein